MESFTDTPSALYAKPFSACGKIDAVEDELRQKEQVECTLTHTFTPGLYTRSLFIPKGTGVVSKIHKTTHPVMLVKGVADVWTESTGWVRLEAPWLGITTPGTRRVIETIEDTLWIAFHPTTETDLEKIEDQIIQARD